jgi:hypothetical protein
MLKIVKTFVALVIFVCLFLPISQCTTKGVVELDPKTDEIVKTSPDKVEERVIFSSLFAENDNTESVLVDIVLLVSFLLPLTFSLTPKLSEYRAVLKRCLQSLFSVWFIYLTYNLVFLFTKPLPAGWLLLASSGLFFIIVNLEWLQRKTYKNPKNTRQQKQRLRGTLI